MSLIRKKQSNKMPRRRLVERDSEISSKTNVDIFRRNRTLTGSTSNRFSSIDAKLDLESPRTHAHHLTIQRRKIFTVFIVVFLSALFIWLLVNNFTARAIISFSDTDITKTIDTSKYEKVIQDYLDMNPTNRFTFLLDQTAFVSYVSNELPEVADIAAPKSAGIGDTNFTITMRKPVAGWTINDKQYYVDSKGVAFEQNYFATPGVQIVDESGVSVQSGTATAIASKRFLSFVGLVVSTSKSSGYVVTQAVLPSGTTRELVIHLKDYSFSVKLSIDRSVGEQIEDMSRAIKYFVGKGQTPQYIDVRVSRKAFYM